MIDDMKKILTPLLGMIVLVVLSSCEKTNIIENYYPNPNKSFIYTVFDNQWTDHGYQVNHIINLPELTNYYMKQGSVSVAISFDDEQSYDMIPATFDGIAYSARYSLGKVTLYIEDPLIDQNIIVPIPEKLTVKIVLSETDYIE